MKKQLLLISLGALVASSSFASLPYLYKRLQQSPAKVQKAKLAHEGYANFSGAWVGFCDDTPEEEESMTIEQSEDLSSFTVNQVEFPIDSISTNSSNENFNIHKSITHLRWSSDGQQILGTLLDYSKEGNMSQGNLVIAVVKYNWYLENGKLHTNQEFSLFNDGSPVDTHKSHCVFSKD
ncbi:hypothetical protein BN59_02851 [Legionella massiliensis]|uniref:Uncharacterized protein n=1 Tax=Legionella massiliensis TaxID=1034943 RepID=A0A078L067_9GAMM|nr:hypothetical protein [Legionella massiliensis]CDZ78541.1 hypothetical protein BN59_02851 [Legionella massiliensis]CEE14279.1 hypothetical protein BN1094_02851 [Legionella massiliensis]